MRSLTLFFTVSSVVLTIAACSPKPAAEPTEATPAEDTVITADADGAGGADAAAPPSADMPPPPEGARRDRPDGPDRRGGRGFDGPMTLSDMQARSDRRFNRMDANGDGVITADEMDGDGDGGGRGGRMLERADANNDGRITRAEMQAASQAMFRMMDANGDGTVSEDERPQFGGGGPR